MIIASVVLPSPGGPGQQHVVGRLAAAARGVEHERELVAHHALADELLEPARAQRGLGRTLEVVGARLDQRLGREALGHQLLAVVSHARRPASAGPRAARRRPRRRPPAPRCPPAPSTRRRRPRARSSRARRAPRRPGRAGPRRRPRRAGCGTLAGAPIRSLSSSTMRCAPLRPMPGHALQRLEVLVEHRAAQPVRRVHREHRERQPRTDAADGLHGLEDLALVGVGEPEQGQRVLADHAATWPAAPTSRPAAPPAWRASRARAGPTPPTSTTAASSRTACTVPWTDAITGHPPSVERRCCMRTLWHTEANRCTKTRGQPRRRAACSAVAHARCAARQRAGRALRVRRAHRRAARGGRRRGRARRRRRPAAAARRAAAGAAPSSGPAPCPPARSR